jgi:hypothetical protein
MIHSETHCSLLSQGKTRLINQVSQGQLKIVLLINKYRRTEGIYQHDHPDPIGYMTTDRFSFGSRVIPVSLICLPRNKKEG